MAYLDLLEDESIDSQYLAIIKPRRRALGFSLFSGSVYRVLFEYGEVVECYDNSTPLVAGSSVTLGSGEFYYDVSSSYLYVRLSSGLNPDTTWCIAKYEIYVGTIDAHIGRIPTDTSSRTVYFEPLISKSSNIRQTSENSDFGFNPIQSSQLVVINGEHILDAHLYDSSFNRAECLVYHALKQRDQELDATNIKLVLSGFINSFSWDPPRVSFRVVDRVDRLSEQFIYEDGSGLFTASSFAELDPQYDQRCIRTVYGFIGSGFVPVNIDYKDEAPTTSDNRTWVVLKGQTGLSDIVSTVPSSPVSTTTRTYLSSVVGFNVGDSVWLDKASDEYVIVSAVGANYIDHAAITTACVNGDLAKRAFVGFVDIVQDDVTYKALYGRDYIVTTSLADNTSGFVFNSSLETNLSMPQTLRPIDRVTCRVYGRVNNLTLSGPSYGSNDSRTGNMAHPTQLVLDILKNKLSVAESEINASSFTAALTDQSSGIGIAIPDNATSTSFPKYKDLIGKVLKSTLSKLTIDSDQKWMIVTTKPMGSALYQVGDDEILSGSTSFSHDYDEIISSVSVKYSRQEQDLKNRQESWSISTIESDVGKYLHKSTTSKTEDSVWAYEAEASELATRLSFVYGDRRQKVSIKVKNRLYPAKLGDSVDVQRAELPGFNYDADTIVSRKYSIVEIDKNRTQVSITLDDRKGIEDNSGGW